MADAFDPYHKWLGISPKDQPPHHYRLLGIDLFENDLDVIESAADQRMTHVRAFQTGKRSQLSQTILNEIAAARVCLLSPEKKAAYDRQLRDEVALSAPPRVRPPEIGADLGANGTEAWTRGGGVAEPGLDGLRTQAPPRIARRKDRTVWMLWGAAGLMILLLAALVLVARRRNSEREVSPLVDPGASVTAPGPVPDDQLPDEPLAGDVVKVENGSTRPVDLPEPTDPDATGPTVTGGAPDAGTGGADDATARDDATPPSAVPDRPGVVQKAHIPSEAQQQEAQRRLDPLLAETSPQKLMAAALTNGRESSECYVLLLRSQIQAVASGDVVAAFDSADAMAARFEIDSLAVKVELLDGVAASANSPTQFRLIAETAFELVDEAETADRHDLVEKLLARALLSARNAQDLKLVDRITLRILDRRQAE